MVDAIRARYRRRDDPEPMRINELEVVARVGIEQRHADFQSAALPTELPGHGRLSRPVGRASEGRELDPRGAGSSRTRGRARPAKSQ